MERCGSALRAIRGEFRRHRVATRGLRTHPRCAARGGRSPRRVPFASRRRHRDGGRRLEPAPMTTMTTMSVLLAHLARSLTTTPPLTLAVGPPLRRVFAWHATAPTPHWHLVTE